MAFFNCKIIFTVQNIRYRWNNTCSTKNGDLKQTRITAFDVPRMLQEHFGAIVIYRIFAFSCSPWSFEHNLMGFCLLRYLSFNYTIKYAKYVCHAIYYYIWVSALFSFHDVLLYTISCVWTVVYECKHLKILKSV